MRRFNNDEESADATDFTDAADRTDGVAVEATDPVLIGGSWKLECTRIILGFDGPMPWLLHKSWMRSTDLVFSLEALMDGSLMHHSLQMDTF